MLICKLVKTSKEHRHFEFAADSQFRRNGVRILKGYPLTNETLVSCPTVRQTTRRTVLCVDRTADSFVRSLRSVRPVACLQLFFESVFQLMLKVTQLYARVIIAKK